MTQWRDIPTAFNWDGDNLTPPPQSKPITSVPAVKPTASKPQSGTVPLVTKIGVGIVTIPASALEIVNGPAVTTVSADSPKPEAVPVKPVPGLSAEEQVAAAKMEAALEKILGILGEKKEEVVGESNLSQGKPGDPLWDSHIQDLSPSKSAIYPAGRPVNNPNHLMLFLWNGAEVVRAYTQNGWKSRMRRQDGKENPVPERLIEAFIQAGNLKDFGNGIYKTAGI
jgi:hypothetical protein